MTRARRGTRTGAWRGAALTVVALLFAAIPGAAVASTWNEGDVFAGISNGQYGVFSNAGTPKETIDDGLGGFTTGCAFNNNRSVLYTTNFSNARVPRYANAHPHAVNTSIDTSVQGGASPESIAFARDGSFYVGHASGDSDVHHYSATNNFIEEFDVPVGPRGSDWIDLAKDQKTLFYTSEGGLIRRYDVDADAPLTDFADVGGTSFALRILPPGDATGGLLVAHTSDILRLNGAGNVVQTYDVPGEDGWFSLNLDPNGTSFWSGDFGTNNFYRFNINTGAVEVGPVPSGGSLFGLCVKGEPTAGGEPPPPPPPPPPPSGCGRSNFNGLTIQGDAADNTIDGAELNDLLRGGGGDDRLRGLAGNDCVEGEDGNDIARGGAGDDDVNGNDGNDAARGAKGKDDVTGGDGKDEVGGGKGKDEVSGGDGKDEVDGAKGKDEVTGDKGNDDVGGGKRKDEVSGGKGRDLVKGDGGGDRLKGGPGADDIRCGKGDDVVLDATGQDKVKKNCEDVR